MLEEKTKWYKFGYLIKVNGGLYLFGPGRDRWLYLSIAISIISYELYRYKLIGVSVITNFTNISAIVSVTLFGLIIASFAIVTSINNKVLIKELIGSGYYAYTIFSFTWALVWSLISSLLSFASIIFSIQIWVFPFALFSLLYALFDAFSSMFFSLRHIAIMNTRYDKELQDAWDCWEKELKKRNN